MAWFKVDDGFYSHIKTLLIPREVRAEAIGTWTLCGTWSADKLKDGFVPAFMVEELGGTIAGAEALVAAKLWKRKASGFLFVNWDEFQPMREKVLAHRQKETERKANYRARVPHDSGGSSGDVPTGQTRNPDTPTRPVPTRPDPSGEEAKASPPKARETRIPKDWAPTAEHIARAKTMGVDLLDAAENFRLHAETYDRHAASWNGAFTTWLKKTKPTLTPHAAPKKRFVAHDD